VGWAQSLGKGEAIFNVISASAPVIVICAVAYYAIGHRLGYSLRSDRSTTREPGIPAASPAGLDSPIASSQEKRS
jgi:hypothetical protein